MAAADGRADAGFGVRAGAAARPSAASCRARGRLDPAMDRRHYFEPPLQTLFAFARTARFAARAARMGGHDVSAAGTVAFNL